MKLNGKNSWQIFIKELNRRKVVQLVLAYIAFSWLVVQVTDVLVDAFEAPEWIIRTVFIVLIIGLPVVAILSWVFDVTSHGIIKTRELPHPSQLDIKAIPIIFHAALSKELSYKETRKQLKDYVIWSEDYDSLSSVLNDRDCMILFPNSVDALRFAIRIQNHSQKIDLPLTISIIEAPDDYQSDNAELKELARGRALSIDSRPGAIVTTETVKDTILNRGIEAVESAFHPINNAHSVIEQTEYIIEPENICDLNKTLKSYRDTVLYQQTPVGLKIAALLFLTVVAAVLWKFVPSIQADKYRNLAVLPLVNSSTDKTTSQNFVSGFSEDIFNHIAHIPELNLISRRSSQAISENQHSVQEIGDLLNADLILEGTISKHREEVKVNLWLTDSSDGIEVWNKAFIASDSDLLLINRQIIQELSAYLDIQTDAVSVANLTDNPSKKVYPEFLEAKGLLKQPPTQERLSKVEQKLQLVLDQQPNFAPAVAGLCVMYIRWYTLTLDNAHFDRAERECKKANKLDNDNIDVLLALATLYTKKNAYQLAQNYTDRAQAINPSDVDVLHAKAELMAAKSDFGSAVKILNQALQIEPGYWRLYVKLGHIHIRQGNWQQSIVNLQKALQINPNEAYLYNWLGSAFAMQGNFIKAAETYENGLHLEKTSVILANIGNMSYYAGDFKKAVNYYLQAIQIDPTDYRYWLNLADAKDQLEADEFEVQNHYQHALDLALELLTVSPENSEARVIAAWSYAQLDESSKAQKEMTNALQLSPEDPNILFMAALVSARTGQQDKGKALLEQSIQYGFPKAIIDASPIVKQLELI
ncbi:tetratricopeptide repeat protein [Kangiella sediminilitoris]|nr:tetratricopeptide repeat protein [Kangiella sediminilitoris]